MNYWLRRLLLACSCATLVSAEESRQVDSLLSSTTLGGYIDTTAILVPSASAVVVQVPAKFSLPVTISYNSPSGSGGDSGLFLGNPGSWGAGGDGYFGVLMPPPPPIDFGSWGIVPPPPFDPTHLAGSSSSFSGSVPEPSTFALAVVGVGAGVIALRQIRKKRRAV